MYRRSPPGVPDESRAPTMTSHSKSELVMAGHTSAKPPENEKPRQRPYREYVKLHDVGDTPRPAVICFPAGKGASFCVVHTPSDYDRKIKCQTQKQFDASVAPLAEPWDAPRSVKAMVHQAASGSSTTAHSIRRAAEMEDCHPISYVMRAAQEAEDQDSHIQDRIQSTLLRGEGQDE